jgi:hypothetical protein
MYKLKELTDNDVLRHELSIRCAYQVYGDVVGSFYLLEKDGKESILHNEDNIFMIIDELDGKVSYTMFAVDDNFELSDLGYPEFEFHLLDKEYVFLDRETGKSYSIALNERADGEDVDGYNGYVRFTQFNPDTRERATIIFQHMYTEGKMVSPFHTKKPFQVIFQSNVKITKKGEFKSSSKKQFIAKTFSIYDDKLGYDIATIKDYGLSEFLEKGSYALQSNERNITRYYKILYVTDSLYAATGFPFTRQYTLEDMIAMLKERGFGYEIPQQYMDIYNGRDELLNEVKQLIEEIKKNIVFVDEPYVLEMRNKDAN